MPQVTALLSSCCMLHPDTPSCLSAHMYMHMPLSKFFATAQAHSPAQLLATMSVRQLVPLQQIQSDPSAAAE